VNDLNHPRTAGCRCSTQQLNLVGCDCEAVTLPLMAAEVFIDGYASDNKGKFEYVATPGFDLDLHARQTYGSFARVFRTYIKNPPKDVRTPEEKAAGAALARYMTQGDNT
jgi:hypothetical protein